MIACLSFTFRTSSVETLERLTQRAPSPAELIAAGLASEAIRISTCNRHETYAVTEHPDAFASLIREKAGESTGSGIVFTGLDAVRHLCRVAASIDSMVVGENQILAQVRRGEDAAKQSGSSGPVLQRLFVEARRVGRTVRRSTKLGAGSLSIASIAADLAKKMFGSLEKARVLLMGSGEMGSLVARYLADAGASIGIAVHRNRAGVEALAGEIGAEVVPAADVAGRLESSDIVVTAASADEPILTRTQLEAAASRRQGRPLFLIDMAIPRNIDPAAGELKGLYLYDIDDFERIAADHRVRRQGEVGRAEDIVEAAVTSWPAVERQLALRPVVAAAYGNLMEMEKATSRVLPDDAARHGFRIRMRRLFHASRRALDLDDPLERGIRLEGFRRLFGVSDAP